MKTVLKTMVGLIALLFTVLWLRWMVEPEVMATQWALTATGPAGLNNLRGDIGGLFLMSAVFCGIYLLRGNAMWLRAAATGMACVIVGRITGLMIDGFNQAALVSAILEVIFITVFLATARLSSKS